MQTALWDELTQVEPDDFDLRTVPLRLATVGDPFATMDDTPHDLTTLLDLEVRRLSAGQRRRLALARLPAAPRPLWLLDEPLSPLDARWREAFGLMMARHLETGGLILAAVHDPLPIPSVSLELSA